MLTSGSCSRLLVPAAACLFLVVGCASKDKNPYGNPCRAMELEAREMQQLEAEIATMESEAEKLEKAGDAEGEASLLGRVSHMREHRRMLQYSLERNAAECLPMVHDAIPPRDPARREHMERN